jgi:capsular polysaccharide biosynthesis protein/cellulose biosynthesis protein BcsQ
VLLGTALGLAVGLATTALTPKVYMATATLFVGSPVSTDASIAYNLDQFSQQRAFTYSKLAQSRDIAVAVHDDLGLDITPEQLSTKITATPVLKTVLMRISATDSSPQVASDIANTFADEFTKYVTLLETPAGSNQPSAVVKVIQKAEPPSSPTSPRVASSILIGLLGGFVLGSAVNWLLRFLNRRVRTPKHVAESAGAPVLGILPKDAARRSRVLDPATDSSTAYAEALRGLRANLMYANVDAPPKTIAFVSPISTISTTATAANLAVVLDGTGRRVALIDADMHHSRLSSYLGQVAGVEAPAGGGHRARAASQTATGGPNQDLSSVLVGEVAVDYDVLSRVSDTEVDVLFAGSPSKAAGERLASDVLVKVLGDFRSRYDFVFCDTPGLIDSTDAAEIGRVCDGVILVAEQGQTRIDHLSETAETLRSLGAKIIGAVITEVR